MSTKTKKDIKYGNVDVDSPSEWSKKDVKVRITTFLDEDLLDAIKAEAVSQNKKYQTYLNERLREMFLGEETLEARLRRVEEIVAKKSVS